MDTHIATLKGKGKKPVRVNVGPAKFWMMTPGEPQEVPAAAAQVLRKNPAITVKEKKQDRAAAG